MDDDESRRAASRSQRPIEKKLLPAGPAKDLRDAVYRLYAQADRPQLAALAERIAGDDDLPGSPGKDLIGKIISGEGLASQHDTVAVAVALARLAGCPNIEWVAEQVRQLWVDGATVDPVERPGHRESQRTFFDHLLQSHTKLFAGRVAELAAIKDFLNTEGSGYVFVEGLSGYGKTSLLARFVQDQPEIAYHFISQQYKGTDSGFDPTLARPLYANLCEQLDPDHIPTGDTDTLRARLRQALWSPTDRPVTIVIDAIDEIDRHPNFLYGLLPVTLPAGITVVLSARSQGDRCYLGEVGLSPRDVGRHLSLGGLGPDVVAELLDQVGPRGRHLAQRPGFAERLHQVSDGDPFYLRFLIEDVELGTLNEANIGNTPSGLDDYLARQFEYLDRSTRLDQQRDILGFIRDARTALTRRDLIHLVPGLSQANFAGVIRDIHRFLLVHDGRYSFCHNRFKEYLLKH